MYKCIDSGLKEEAIKHEQKINGRGWDRPILVLYRGKK